VRWVLIVIPALLALGIVIALRAHDAGVAPGGGFDTSRPILGAVRTPLPEGNGREVAERACLSCHSTDLLRQQRLTEKQWTAVLTKMAGWGAELADSDRAVLLPYLMSQFGPDNDRFRPVTVRPIQP
jgi:mono/diheme cytochrome c family protein